MHANDCRAAGNAILHEGKESQQKRDLILNPRWEENVAKAMGHLRELRLRTFQNQVQKQRLVDATGFVFLVHNNIFIPYVIIMMKRPTKGFPTSLPQAPGGGAVKCRTVGEQISIEVNTDVGLEAVGEPFEHHIHIDPVRVRPGMLQIRKGKNSGQPRSMLLLKY